MRGCGLHGLDQIRNQVTPALILRLQIAELELELEEAKSASGGSNEVVENLKKEVKSEIKDLKK